MTSTQIKSALWSGPPRFLDPSLPTIKYNASCHSARIRFAVRGPPLSTVDAPTPHRAGSCNCSLCAKNGWLLVYPQRANVAFEHGFAEAMKRYRREGGRNTCWFCGVCGTCVGMDPEGRLGKGENDIVCINVKAFDGIDVLKLDVKILD